ncbi:hypothetical protein TWF718_010256 [Orbilia javanica]|uniref:Uncharacterized protein n=1 Tax=Orbilia javanica TaxID=47235 RepID=A0AAN8RDU3_9PEZI
MYHPGKSFVSNPQGTDWGCGPWGRGRESYSGKRKCQKSSGKQHPTVRQYVRPVNARPREQGIDVIYKINIKMSTAFA